MRVLVLVLVLAGCGAPPPQFPVEETTTSREVVTPAPTTTVTTTAKGMDASERRVLEKAACENGVPFNPTSNPYQGAGPHPITVHEVVDPASHMQHSPVTTAGDSTMFLNDVNLVQLIACVVPVLGQKVREITCYFAGGEHRDWPFHEATYQVTVREARTGRVVTTLTVPGDETEDNCPLFGTDYPDTVVARSLTTDGLAKAVEPIRSGTA